MMEAAGADPLEPYPGVLSKWRCRCRSCREEITPQLTVIQQGCGACPHCADYGFDPTAPAVVYVITHPEWRAHKVGVAGVTRRASNREGRRLADHERAGWEIYDTIQFIRGADAKAAEQGVLRWLREDKQLGPYLTTGNGWTETVAADAITPAALWRQVQIETYRVGTGRS
jgi:hypothetical protein